MTKKIDDTQGEGSDLGVAGTLMACLVVLFLFFAVSEQEFLENFEGTHSEPKPLSVDEEVKDFLKELEEEGTHVK